MRQPGKYPYPESSLGWGQGAKEQAERRSGGHRGPAGAVTRSPSHRPSFPAAF